MISEDYRGTKQWSRDKQAVFTVVWISFLAAAIGTMVFFALFDPVDLTGILKKRNNLRQKDKKADGFFFFWVLCALCSAVTAYLVRTAPKRDAKPRD